MTRRQTEPLTRIHGASGDCGAQGLTEGNGLDHKTPGRAGPATRCSSEPDRRLENPVDGTFSTGCRLPATITTCFSHPVFNFQNQPDTFRVWPLCRSLF